MPEYRGVILLNIETLRADRPPYHGYSRETSLPLYTLETKHGFFTDAISGSAHTHEEFPELLTGRCPDIFARQGYRLVTESTASIPDGAVLTDQNVPGDESPHIQRFATCSGNVCLKRTSKLTKLLTNLHTIPVNQE